MQGRSDEDAAALVAPAAPEPPAEPRADTAVSPVIRGASVSIPTPAWGTAIVMDDDVVVAELVDDDDQATRPSSTATGGIPIPEPAVARPPVLGALAAVAAVATAILHGIAVSAASARDPQTATVLAWAAIIVSVVAIVLGILAAILRSGRWTGVVAAAFALIANPWVLLQVLRFFAP